MAPRRRKARNPQDEVFTAQLLAAACHSTRNRRRLRIAREAYAARVAPALNQKEEVA